MMKTGVLQYMTVQTIQNLPVVLISAQKKANGSGQAVMAVSFQDLLLKLSCPSLKMIHSDL